MTMGTVNNINYKYVELLTFWRYFVTLGLIMIGVGFLILSPTIAQIGQWAFILGALVLAYFTIKYDLRFRSPLVRLFILISVFVAVALLHWIRIYLLATPGAEEFRGPAGRIMAHVFGTSLGIHLAVWSFSEPIDPIFTRAAIGLSALINILSIALPFALDETLADVYTYPFNILSRIGLLVSFIILAWLMVHGRLPKNDFAGTERPPPT